MRSKDTRSLTVIREWQRREYRNEAQRVSTLQVIINGALEEQNRITRAACSDVVEQVVSEGNFFLADVQNACAEVEAL